VNGNAASEQRAQFRENEMTNKILRLKVARLSATFFFCLATACVLQAQTPTPEKWVATWASSQQIPEPNNELAAADLRDATLRQIVHLSIGGQVLRIHLSNAFGLSALHITSAHIARPVSPAASRIDPASDRALHFSGSEDVLIPPGAEYISDPLEFLAAPLSGLAITMRIDGLPVQQTGHPGSRTTSYITHSDSVSAADFAGAKSVDHWYFISGIDVGAVAKAFSIVALGDSITDGHGATTNGNDRWPDVLARRLQADPITRTIAIVNEGTGGNHLLTDGLGPNALARFDRDVLAQAGVRYMIVLEGINDVGILARGADATAAQHDLLVRRMIGAYEQIVARAHAQGIKAIGVTILPFAGSDYYLPGSANEADRLKVNEWIRASGHFDALVDLDNLLADPANPSRLLPAYDSGDHLHPSPKGYQIMAEGFPLSLFNK
jgi:lysophospholipase L1-like esterase